MKADESVTLILTLRRKQRLTPCTLCHILSAPRNRPQSTVRLNKARNDRISVLQPAVPVSLNKPIPPAAIRRTKRLTPHSPLTAPLQHPAHHQKNNPTETDINVATQNSIKNKNCHKWTLSKRDQRHCPKKRQPAACPLSRHSCLPLMHRDSIAVSAIIATTSEISLTAL